ncbi:hypothetical protein Ciccas_005107 [Cichlidogyrus casuarinus]|uniref:PAN domain protein n=1 Tax=Cichlidogyrus casuarinus TaxID=1844966 RepID=A0ABD2Q9K1_9PLAT
MYQRQTPSFYFTDPLDGYQIPVLETSNVTKSYEECLLICYHSEGCRTITFDSHPQKMQCYTSENFYPKKRDLNAGEPSMRTARLLYASFVREQDALEALGTLKLMPIDYKLPLKISTTVYEHLVVQPPYQTNTRELDIPKYNGAVFTQLPQNTFFAGYSLVRNAHNYQNCSKIALSLIDGRNVIGFTYSAKSRVCQLGYAPRVPMPSNLADHFELNEKKLFKKSGDGQKYYFSVIKAFEKDRIDILPQKINTSYECSAKCLNSITFNCVAFFLNEQAQLCVLASTNRIGANATKADSDVILDLYTLQSDIVFPRHNVVEADVNLLDRLTHFPTYTTNLANECLAMGSKQNQTCHGYAACYDNNNKFFMAGIIKGYQDWIDQARKVTKPEYTCRVYKREFLRNIAIREEMTFVQKIQNGPSKGAVIGASLGLFFVGLIIVGVVTHFRG